VCEAFIGQNFENLHNDTAHITALPTMVRKLKHHEQKSVSPLPNHPHPIPSYS